MMLRGIFYKLSYFLSLDVVVVLLSIQGQKALRFPQILNCVPKLNEVLWVGNNVRVNN